MRKPGPEAEGPWRLVVIAVAGNMLVAVLTARLARTMSLEAFEAYAVAAAGFLLLVSVAPLGVEKLALRVLPPLAERGDPQRVDAYLRFALRHACIGTALAGAAGLVWAFGVRDLPAAARTAFIVAVLGLPFGVLAKLGLEILTALGGARLATGIVRLGVPAIALGLVLTLSRQGADLTGAAAVAAWGAGWVAAATLLALRVWAAAPSAHMPAPPGREAAAWRRAAAPFWIHRLGTALIAHSGIIVLDWMGASAAAVGGYAAATVVIGLGLVLSTATTRAYAREVAILIDRRDGSGLDQMAGRRRRRLLPVLALFLGVTFAFSDPILALFRPDFVEEGVPALRILALSAVFTMVFALAPTVLKFRARNGASLGLVAAAAVLQIVMLLVLVPPLSATGAAIASALSAVVLYGGSAFLARRAVVDLSEVSNQA